MKTHVDAAVSERGFMVPLVRGRAGGAIGRVKGAQARREGEEKRVLQEVCSFTFEGRCEAVAAGRGGRRVCPYTLEVVDGPMQAHCLAVV